MRSGLAEGFLLLGANLLGNVLTSNLEGGRHPPQTVAPRHPLIFFFTLTGRCLGLPLSTGALCGFRDLLPPPLAEMGRWSARLRRTLKTRQSRSAESSACEEGRPSAVAAKHWQVLRWLQLGGSLHKDESLSSEDDPLGVAQTMDSKNAVRPKWISCGFQHWI